MRLQRAIESNAEEVARVIAEMPAGNGLLLIEAGDLEKRYSKLEVQRFQEEIDVLNSRYGGIKDLMGKPGAVVVVDAAVDANAVREANVLGVPVFGVVDTNVNPTDVTYVVPGNDDAIKGLQLLLDYFAQAVAEGAGSVKKADEKPVKKEEK